ncbi:MAG TPA: hypothetical protein VK524_29555 [Polyangiaceae bacterium]|nr:hypothetical protein [Polyangiaceae bacterium]
MQVTTDLKARTQNLSSTWAARSRELSDKTGAALHNLELQFWRNVKTLCQESRAVPEKLNQVITALENRAENALTAEKMPPASSTPATPPGKTQAASANASSPV